MHKCPCNGVQAVKSCTCTLMSLNIEWTITTQGLYYRPMHETCDKMLRYANTS